MKTNLPLRLLIGVMASSVSFVHVAVADADVTPPDPPETVVVDQGSGWRQDNGFDVWWRTPSGQETPIAKAHYELCPAAPQGPCTVHEAVGMDVASLYIVLPHAGWFRLRVWLEDSAGNVNSADKSPAVMLRFDDVLPPGAVLVGPDSWLGEASATEPLSYAIAMAEGADWPLSGIGGYSLTTNGETPDGEADVFAAQDYDRFTARYDFVGLAEGETAVKIRTISGSGVASQAVYTGAIRVDRSPPTLSEPGWPSQGWQRRPIELPLIAWDQTHLSGMAPATDDQPVEHGGHITYELDGASPVRVRGDRATVGIEGDGVHRLVYRAFDVAGNGSVEREAVFRIDGTGPVGAFRALDPADPRRVEVEVSDATSGVADGRIEMRRVGEQGFRVLDARREGGLLTARMDDLALQPGRYELRAVVTDVAGNESVIGRWADGSAATVGMPLRLGSALEASGEARVESCAKPTRRAKARAKRKPPRRKCRVVISPTKTLSLGHGKPGSTSGRLTTGQGEPIADAVVAVEAQARSGGGFATVGSARTDAQGRFRFALPPGPSRTVRYRYEGTNTVRPAAAELSTRVPAAARLTVDRRRVRNGQAVRFSGRLLGKPIPAGGKVVALQAKVGSGWRTFATPRADAKGAFRHRYRFTATTGTRRYAFRAVVAREEAYPYEEGRSRLVRVTVRGGRR